MGQRQTWPLIFMTPYLHMVKEPEQRNRMREIFKSGSVGRAPGNRCLYLEVDSQGSAVLQVVVESKFITLLKSVEALAATDRRSYMAKKLNSRY